jgi:cell division protein FtsB
MRRSTHSIKPIKDRKVSAVSLYIPPEIKEFWYGCYDDLYKDNVEKPSISEFLSGMLNDRLKQLTVSENGLLTLEISENDLKAWDNHRKDESHDPDNPIPWSEFIIEKVNAGINLLEETKYSGPDSEEYEKKIDSLKETNSRLMKQVADLKQELKIKDVTAGRNLIRDAILDALGKADKSLTFIDLARAVDNKKVLYAELMRLFDDEIIHVETKGKTDYFSYNA